MEVRTLQITAHTIAVRSGWWNNPDRNVGELIALMHSELSEALEVWRSGTPIQKSWQDPQTGKPEGLPSELADTVIRIADFCEAFGIDLDAEIQNKMDYNRTRSYRHGGKIA